MGALFALAVTTFRCLVPGVGAAFTSATVDPANALAAVNSFSLIQAAGLAGCISETGTTGTCTDGKGLDYASQAAFSPDGKHLYVLSTTSQAVVWFTRDAATGYLTQAAGCLIPSTGTITGCTKIQYFDYPVSIEMSPDGKNVYVGAGGMTSSSPSTGTTAPVH
jgi:DNA-binding beta-propeller fold protein YncE